MAPTKPKARPELKKPGESGQAAAIAPCSAPFAQPSRAPEHVFLRVPENPQSVNGRVRLEFPRRPSQNRSQANDRMPMTSENDIVPGLCPSYKISQTRFGFADRNIHRRRISSPPWPRRKSWSLPLSKSSQLARLRTPDRRRTYPRRSGGVASPASASSASSAPIDVCALDPRRRKDTLFSLASLRPRAIRTGAFANECSRTL